jgi:chromosome segregation ATPase
MTDVMPGDAEERLRTCGYALCGRELPRYHGRGRPQEYCRDRRWEPGDKTCQQMDKDRRAAELAAGLDVPLDAFRAAAAPVIATGEALADRIVDLLGELRAVDGSALSRVEQAERRMVEAVVRTQAAEDERDRAHRDARDATVERDRALAAATDADRRAAATQAAADERISAALDRAGAAERAAGDAQARAAHALMQVDTEAHSRETAEQRAADIEAEARTLYDRLAAARAVEADLRTKLATADGRAQLAEADAAGHRQRVDQLLADTIEGAQQIAELTAARDEARAILHDQHTALAASEHTLATARADLARATNQAAAAETRVDQLLAALGRSPGPADNRATPRRPRVRRGSVVEPRASNTPPTDPGGERP